LFGFIANGLSNAEVSPETQSKAIGLATGVDFILFNLSKKSSGVFIV
jgi:hypothetical protein